MWNYKEFKSEKAFYKWVDTHGHKHQWERIFVDNVPFAIEYRKNKIIDIQ